MPALKDLTGQTYGRLVVLQRSPEKSAQIKWICRCACGAEVSVQGINMRSGVTQSCGCLQRELVSARSGTHRSSNTRMYFLWTGMHQRCTNPKHVGYRYYGERGIKVCERWNDFEVFLADMGPKPPGRSLDRIDNDGHYEPSNCRWSTFSDQRRNARKAGTA